MLKDVTLVIEEVPEFLQWLRWNELEWMGYHTQLGTLSKLSVMSSSPDMEVCGNVFLYMLIAICDEKCRFQQSVGFYNLFLIDTWTIIGKSAELHKTETRQVFLFLCIYLIWWKVTMCLMCRSRIFSCKGLPNLFSSHWQELYQALVLSCCH